MAKTLNGILALKQLVGFKTISLAAEDGDDTGGGSPAALKTLPFNMEQQLQNQWCWAATSFSVQKFFESTTSWTQCKIVNAELNMTTCCGGDASTNTCNRWWYLEKALSRVSNLNQMTSGKFVYPSLKAEIDGERPLCLRIGWNGGGGHFVAISAYDDNAGNPLIIVNDPWFGRSTGVEFNSFPGTYHGGGSWTHSYTTKN